MDFFNKLGSKISSGANAVATKTKDIAGATKINMQISEDEKEVNKLFFELGKNFYESIKGNAPDNYKDKVDAITELFAKIENEKEQVREIKGIVLCEKCGVELEKGVKFCSACGTPVPEKEVVVESNSQIEASTIIKCPVCGREESADAVFCSGCGCKLK